MVDAPLAAQLSPDSTACRRAGQALAAVGYLNLAAALALAIGVPVVGVMQRGGIADGMDFRDPLFYCFWIPPLLFFLLMGAGFLYARISIAEGFYHRIPGAKTLTWINLTIVLIEGAGIGCGLIFDPPNRQDLPWALVACGLVGLFVAALAVTMVALNRAQRQSRAARDFRD